MSEVTVGVVLSHPFHVGLGTDFRLFNQIYPLTKYGLRLKIISQFGPGLTAPPKPIQYYCLNSFPAIFEQGYKITRYFLNKPFLARQILRSTSYLERTLDSFSRRLERFLAHQDIDVLLAIHPLAAGACSKVCSKIRPPIVTDIHGIWADELIESGSLERDSKQAAIAAAFEQDCLENADTIVVVSQELGARLTEKYSISPDRIVVIDPCVLPRAKQARKLTTLSKIVCPATSTYREGLELLLRSMSLVQRDFPETQLFLTRKGDTLSKTKQLAKQLKIRTDYFYFADIMRFYRFLQQCDIGIVTSSEGVTRRISYPAKLYDYLAVGLPIVANDIGGWSQVIRDSGAGILTDSSPEGLATGISSLIRDPQRAFELGSNGLNYLRSELNPESRLEAFNQALTSA